MNPTLLKTVLKPVIKRAVQRSLSGRVRSQKRPQKGRFTRADVNNILRQTWLNYDKLAPQAPLKKELTVGNKIVLLLVCFTFDFFQSLLALDVDRQYAIELTADVTWKVVAPSVKLLGIITRIATRDPIRRIYMPYNMLMSTLFNEPGFQYQLGVTGDGVTLDITRCPAAAYFQTHQALDVCVGAWCSIDFSLTEAWGGHLERTGTIAMGCDLCDFRAKV
jgi:L-2-amino-thiazoline-4-carboxylic acid hydrolase